MTNQQMQYAYWLRMRQQQIYRVYAAGSASSKNNSYDKIAKVSNDYFLNYLEYSPKNIDSLKAADYLKSFDPQFALGRCTGIYDKRTGRALRQLDWYYNNETEFIIKMNADQDKKVFASIGVTAASPKMTRDIAKNMVDTGSYYEYFDFLPFFTVDGVNENHIFAQSNVVNKHGIDININKDDPTKIDCCIPMVVRYILDKFSLDDMIDAKAVHDKLDKLHIFGTSKLGGYNSHILVACHTSTLLKSYVVEFTADLILVNEFSVMTNFRTINSDLSTITLDSNYMVDWNEVEQDGIGLERWETCAKFLKQKSGSYEEFKYLRKQLNYTYAYCRPFSRNLTWLTDNLSGDLTILDSKAYHDTTITDSRKHIFDVVLSGYRDQFDHRARLSGEGLYTTTWHTTHSAIYDLVNLSCNIQSLLNTSWNIPSIHLANKLTEDKSETKNGMWMLIGEDGHTVVDFSEYSESGLTLAPIWQRKDDSTTAITFNIRRGSYVMQWQLYYDDYEIDDVEHLTDPNSKNLKVIKHGTSEHYTLSWIDHLPPDSTSGGVWYIMKGATEGGWLTKGNMLTYDASSKSWKLGNAKIAFESQWKGFNNSTVDMTFELNFSYAKTLTKNNAVIAIWYESTAGIPTWMLGGRWSIDGVAKSTAIVDNNEYTLWGNDNYHVKWNKSTNTWSGKRNGRTMYNISTTLANARTFNYTTSNGGSYTATWSAT